MFRPPLGLAALLGLATVVSLPGSPQQNQPKRYALLVGVNEYDHNSLPKLGCAENDVQRLKKVLEGKGYQVELLTGKAATKVAIEAAVGRRAENHKKGDTLLVGLAGHGVQFGGKG